MDSHLLTVILLGIVEGLTEFLPVSSTGHLILASELLGYNSAQWATFNVIIQLGAILAVVVLYWRTFWNVAIGLLGREASSWRFLVNLLLAFLPSAVLGLALHSYIEAMLGAPKIVATALILGGIAILLIERLLGSFRYHAVDRIPFSHALGIGIIQCLSMIPGVSRSGATIMGALSLGVDRKTAAEFSFFLAIPTMIGATTLETYKSREALMSSATNWGDIGIGFVVSFIVAIVVIKWFVGLVSRQGFAPFAWYRIVAGTAALIWLIAR